LSYIIFKASETGIFEWIIRVKQHIADVLKQSTLVLSILGYFESQIQRIPRYRKWMAPRHQYTSRHPPTELSVNTNSVNDTFILCDRFYLTLNNTATTLP